MCLCYGSIDASYYSALQDYNAIHPHSIIWRSFGGRGPTKKDGNILQFSSLLEFAAATGRSWVLLPPVAPPNSRAFIFIRQIHESYGMCRLYALELTAHRLSHVLSVPWPHEVFNCDRVDYENGLLTFQEGEDVFGIVVDAHQPITLTSGDAELELVERDGIRRVLDTLVGEHKAIVQIFEPNPNPGAH